MHQRQATITGTGRSVGTWLAHIYGSTERLRVKTGRSHRRVLLFLLTGLLCLVLASSGAAATTVDGQTQLGSVDGQSQFASYDGNVTIPEAAEQTAEYAIIPPDNELEAVDDQVEVPLVAKDIGDSKDITGFKNLEVEWDPEVLELVTIEPEASGAIRATDEDFSVNAGMPGYVEVEWWPSGLDAAIDNLAPLIEDDIEEVWPRFDDDPLVTLVFEPRDADHYGVGAEVGDTATVNVHDTATVTSGLTETFSEYDNDNLYYGSSEIEIVQESLEPTVENATGSFVATSTGGYVSFGESSDPGASDALTEFPGLDDDRQIRIEGDYNDSGVWRAEPDDVRFPQVIARASTGDIDTDVNVNEPFEGTIDPENETMTLTTDLEVYVDLVGDDFTFETSMATTASGDLDGDAEMNVDPETYAGDGDVRLVDNQFIVPPEENPGGTLEEEANLDDADESGANYMVMEYELEFEEFTGEESFIDGQIVDSAGEPIANAKVDAIDNPTAEALTDEDGAFFLDGLDSGEQELQILAEGYEEQSTTVELDVLETLEEEFTLQEGTTNYEVEFQVDDEVTEGDVVPVRAEVENTGDGVETQEIELVVDGRTVDSETVELGVAIDDEVSELDHTATLDFEWEAEDPGEANVEVRSQDDVNTTTAEVIDQDDVSIDGLLTGESEQGGFINFDTADESEAPTEGLILPPDGDEVAGQAGEEILLEGDVIGDTWQSTNVDFPDLAVDEFVAEVDAPLGLSGTFDPEENEMTIEGDLEVTVLDDGDELAAFSFTIDANTDGSGALDGSATLDESGGEVTAVDNEYLVPTETGTALDGVLGLPVEEEGLNWLKLNFDFDVEEVDGELERGDVDVAVADEDDDPIEEATVEVAGQDGETDEDGEVSFENIDAEEYELTVDASGYRNESTNVTVETDETTTVEVELEAGEPEFDVTLFGDSVEEGDTAEITATVENVGEGAGEQDIDISIGEDVSTTETVELAAGESTQIEVLFETEQGEAGSYDAVAESADASDSAEVDVREPLGSGATVEATLDATVDTGFISFDEETEDDAVAEGLGFPENFEDEDASIDIEGVVYDTGEWVATDVTFPELNTEEDGDGLTAAVDPDGLRGEIDTESGAMTVEGDLTVTVTPDSEDPPAFTFGFEAVSGESGALDGEGDLDEDGGSVTLVDNDFAIPTTTGDGLVDNTLGLPVDDPALNWLELGFDVSLDDDVEDVEDPLGDQPAYDAKFDAEIAGGFISFDEETEDDAIAEGLGFPENFEDEDAAIEIAGLIVGDQWEATDVSFPDLNTEEDGDGLTAAVDPDGLRGEIDTESDEMSIEGDLTVTVTPDSEDPPAFTFGFDAVASESGALDGEGDLDEDGGSVTLVDNDFAIPATTGDGLVDNTLGLPVDDPALNWLELDVSLDIEELEEPVEPPADDDDADEETDEESEDTESASLDVELETTISDDGAVEVTATLENENDEEATETVEIELGGERYTEEVAVASGSSSEVTTSFALDDDPDEYEATLQAGETSTAASVSESEDEDDVEAGVTSISMAGDQGFISFAEPDGEETAIEEGLLFPENFEDEDAVIEIEGVVEDDGTWESTEASFPTLNTEPDGSGISAEVEVPDGFSGTIDTEADEMTITGGFEVSVDGNPFEFQISGTTGDSGVLSGSADLDSDGGTVTLVDNEYVVEDTTGNALIDQTLGLPVEEPGENWLVIEFDVDIEEGVDEKETDDDEADDETDDETEEVEEDHEEEESSFLVAFGQLIGLGGLLAGVVTTGTGLAGRVISAIDPDPGA